MQYKSKYLYESCYFEGNRCILAQNKRWSIGKGCVTGAYINTSFVSSMLQLEIVHCIYTYIVQYHYWKSDAQNVQLRMHETINTHMYTHRDTHTNTLSYIHAYKIK